MTQIEESSIDLLRAVDNDFARSLCQQHDRTGKLSTKQSYWVTKLLKGGSLNGKPAQSYGEVDCDMSGIVTRMHDATEHLKWPKIRLETEGCKPVVLSVAGPNSKNPGTINITDGGPYGGNIWYGRILTTGEYQPSKSCIDEVLDLLIRVADDPASAAAAYGHKTGNCCFCRKELTDNRSTDVGYGPVCADHYNLPWGE